MPNDTENANASPLIQSTGSQSIGWMGSIRDKDAGHVNVHQGCASLSWGMMERVRAKFPDDEEFEVYISIRPENVEDRHEVRNERSCPDPAGSRPKVKDCRYWNKLPLLATSDWIVSALLAQELEDENERYRKALEEIAGNESGVNAERADGIAIAALAFENTEDRRTGE